MMLDGVQTIIGINDLTDAGCKSNGAALRLDAASEVRAFLAQHVPGVARDDAALAPSPGGEKAPSACDGGERRKVGRVSWVPAGRWARVGRWAQPAPWVRAARWARVVRWAQLAR